MKPAVFLPKKYFKEIEDGTFHLEENYFQIINANQQQECNFLSVEHLKCVGNEKYSLQDWKKCINHDSKNQNASRCKRTGLHVHCPIWNFNVFELY